jgi:hypothetical protein
MTATAGLATVRQLATLLDQLQEANEEASEDSSTTALGTNNGRDEPIYRKAGCCFKLSSVDFDLRTGETE